MEENNEKCKQNDIEIGASQALMTGIVDPELGKAFRYAHSGLEKSARKLKAEYLAIGVPANLETVLEACKHGEVSLVLGSVAGLTANEGLKILSRDRYVKEHAGAQKPHRHRDQNGMLVATRTKDNFEPAPILLIDHDVNASTPELFRELTPEDLIRQLAGIFPGFAEAGYIRNYGSSAGLIAPEGAPLTGLGSFHLYFTVENASDIARFKETLAARCILGGWFWRRELAGGRSTLETLFDLKAISPERLVYETRPILHDGLSRQALPPLHVPGAVLDTEQLADLTEEELAELVQMTESPPRTVNGKRPGSSVVGVTRDGQALRWDTEITLADRTQTTPRQFADGEQETAPCFAPFREDRNASAFMAKHPGRTGEVYLHDSAKNITYFVNPEEPSDQAQTLPFKGRLATIETMAEFLQAQSISVRYNLIKKDLDLEVPGYAFSPDNLSTRMIWISKQALRLTKRLRSIGWAGPSGWYWSCDPTWHDVDLPLQEFINPIPSLPIRFVSVQVFQKHLAPSIRPLSGTDPVDRHNGVGRSSQTFANSALAIAVAPIQGHKNHKIAVEVFDGEPAVVIRRPAAFDLDTARFLAVLIDRQEIVTGAVRVGLIGVNPADQQFAQHQKLGALRRQGRVQAGHRRRCIE